MKIKADDKVKVIAGKDKGKTGKVLQIFASEHKVVVEGVNLMIKNQRPKKQGEKGQRIQFPAPMSLSKVMIICPRCNKPARVGFKTTVHETGSEDKKVAKTKIKNRICHKCQETI